MTLRDAIRPKPLDGRLTLITAPAVEPVELEQAKAHLRVDGNAEDDLIESLISSARLQVEQYTGRALITQTWEITGTDFPNSGYGIERPIELPLPPLQSVSSVKYLDSDYAEQTWAASNYTVDAPAGELAMHGAIIPASGTVSYPTVAYHPNAVTVQFVAGYGISEDTVPEMLRRGIMALVAHLFENRETSDSQMPQAIALLLDPARVEFGIA